MPVLLAKLLDRHERLSNLRFAGEQPKAGHFFLHLKNHNKYDHQEVLK